MAQNYQLCLIVLIVVFLSQSACFALFVPGPDTPEQFFFIEGLGDGGILGAGAETAIVGNTGPDLSAFAAFFPFLLLAPLLLGATAPAAPAAPAPAAAAPAAPAPVPAAPSPSVTTPVLPTSTCVLQCPATYMMLDDTTISPNCYIASVALMVSWAEALVDCLRTPGAYLWRPNSMAEANAVRDKFGIGTSVDVWTGANDLRDEGAFSFSVENSRLLFTALPFGTATLPVTPDNDCVSIQLQAWMPYLWTAQLCSNTYGYVCEVPPTCP
ncbi:uncharacterized protein LOC127715671 isoform X3 [Mytilus californianus]|uniref:uncharacterized protein LOC127715671 isoform X2 n=1 Tax=Mytilus californianus TaxID=6549 RepID=UPI002245A854|nr:uncharacterized protein LOC127715671 isoform X2 [Mytilus californianus]XP_052077795.1 uncharacterized protein LOC127715671 isoform X3 [Mytilus californianus]